MRPRLVFIEVFFPIRPSFGSEVFDFLNNLNESVIEDKLAEFIFFLSFYTIFVGLFENVLLAVVPKLFLAKLEQTLLLLKLHEELYHLVVDLHFSQILVEKHGLVESLVLSELLRLVIQILFVG